MTWINTSSAVLTIPNKVVLATRTSSARLYEFTSKNGIVVSASIMNVVSMRNILPRLASSTHLDDRGTQQDELHKKRFVDQIEKDIDSVTAVLVLANGTVPRVNVGTNSAISIQPTIFTRPHPRTSPP